MVLLLIFPCGTQGVYKVLPHGGKEIQHHAALQTDAAVHDAVLLEQGIAGAYLPGLVPDGKAVSPGDDIGDLGVRVAVHGTHAAGLKGVFHAHGVLAVSQHAALHPGAAGFRGNFGMGHPRDILMCFFHYSITSFPVQMQKGLPHNAVRQSPGSELRSALSVYWGCLPM